MSPTPIKTPQVQPDVTTDGRVSCVSKVFTLATGLPVIVISYLLVRGVGKCSGSVQKIGAAECWIRRAVAAFFIGVGVYYIITVYGSSGA